MDKEIKDLELNHKLEPAKGFGYILNVRDTTTDEIIGYYPIEKTGFFTVEEWMIRYNKGE